MGKRKRRVATVLALCAGVAACASNNYATIAPAPPEAYTRLGHAEGRGCGAQFLAFGLFPPFILGTGTGGMDHRAARAYDAAVESVTGATALVDVRISESWYWAVLGSLHCTTVEGEAIR